ncbi:hypothetical protein F4W05_20170 [Ewingella americana]|uniref:hypothetical protein n=1 Tax=Ewingella americana TaxID=41202 RepID=UPI001239BBD7|nr:hypothetical protein [Ewingella americana]KAA8726039.1 hypothetical protein F4W05_20170 [Ewingella americana]
MSIPTLRSLDLPAIKSAGVQRARAYAPSGPVCVATQGFEVEFKASEAVGSHPTLKFEIKTKTT